VETSHYAYESALIEWYNLRNHLRREQKRAVRGTGEWTTVGQTTV